MKTSSFRNWIQELWMQHKDEYADLKLPIPEETLTEYFQKYKFWLKREYRHQLTLEKEKNGH
jgi:hypothetical protein